MLKQFCDQLFKNITFRPFINCYDLLEYQGFSILFNNVSKCTLILDETNTMYDF